MTPTSVIVVCRLRGFDDDRNSFLELARERDGAGPGRLCSGAAAAALIAGTRAKAETPTFIVSPELYAR